MQSERCKQAPPDLQPAPPHPHPAPPHPQHTHLEGRARNVLIGKLDGHVVVAGLEGNVLHRAGAVPVVLACHLGLRRALHGQPQATRPCAWGRQQTRSAWGEQSPIKQGHKYDAGKVRMRTECKKSNKGGY